MLSDRLTELKGLRAQVAQLEEAVKNEMAHELARLHLQYGFPDVDSFLAAVRAAAGRRRGRPPASTGPGRRRRRRATVTDEMRAKLKKLVEAGRTTKEIAAELGISMPTVHNQKKQLGLVKPRK